MKLASKKEKLLQILGLTETWTCFFILGFIMMDYPFLDIFNKNFSIFNIPYLYFYLFGGWFVSICVIYLFSRTISISNRETETNTEDGEGK
ncbi:MAG: hypothetical protein FWD70_05520 [Desulfuromonadales bacterium]|nr:hypothetical protein [Desulfuromonadales bacterium]